MKQDKLDAMKIPQGENPHIFRVKLLAKYLLDQNVNGCKS